ncbi:hypothetical protein [Rhizobium lusitanum]|uniref:Uncharacterized protein n=1 Tax=Rhizobium lusitanum TaxID=293958 RepID=A0A1C3VQZ7_9HYPH|nr:hypothetical protein [Rhizobium lusitanum]SCB30211.1 hypothetical protein GA0061101_10676 [Rhizobium lusitanum]
MPSTFTPNLHLELQATGEDTNVWGQNLNNNVFSIIDNALGGTLLLPLTNINVTLTTTQAQNSIIVLSGTLTANVSIIFPNIGRTYLIANVTSGAFSVTLSNGGAASIVVQQGTGAYYTCNTTGFFGTPDVHGPDGAPNGNLPMFSGTSGKVLVDSGTTPPIIATQSEAEAGTDNTVYNTPLRTTQQTTARIASQPQAQAGTDNSAIMTPLRTSQAINTIGTAAPSQSQDVNTTTFPIGTVVMAQGAANRCALVPVFLSAVDNRRYTLAGGGSQLAGNWLARGELDGSTTFTMVQRAS